MSAEYIARAIERSGAVGDHMVVMLALADLADADGMARANLPALARRCHVTAARLAAILRDLERSGEIACRERTSVRVSYEILLPNGRVTNG